MSKSIDASISSHHRSYDYKNPQFAISVYIKASARSDGEHDYVIAQALAAFSHQSCFDSGSKQDLKSRDADSPSGISISIVMVKPMRVRTN